MPHRSEILLKHVLLWWQQKVIVGKSPDQTTWKKRTFAYFPDYSGIQFNAEYFSLKMYDKKMNVKLFLFTHTQLLACNDDCFGYINMDVDSPLASGSIGAGHKH